MPLKIVKATDRISVDRLVVLIFGQPGVGKSSTGFTADDVLCLDFDRGGHRSGFRSDTVQITSWSDVTSMTREDLAPYRTVQVDTIGRCLDVLALDIVDKNPKHRTRSGGLTLQGYGELKSEFKGWISRLLSYDLHVVLIGHDEEHKRGDSIVVRPSITGSSYGEVFQLSDLVGYMFMSGGRRTLDFNPTDDYVGKNPGGFDALEVPDFANEPRWLAGIINRTIETVGQTSERSRVEAEQLEEWREKILAMNDVDAVNAMTRRLSDSATRDIPRGVLLQARTLHKQRAEELWCEWDREKKAFVAKPPEKAVAPKAEAPGAESAPEPATKGATEEDAPKPTGEPSTETKEEKVARLEREAFPDGEGEEPESESDTASDNGGAKPQAPPDDGAEEPAELGPLKVGQVVRFVHPGPDGKQRTRVGQITKLDESSAVVREPGAQRGVRVPLELGKIMPIPEEEEAEADAEAAVDAEKTQSSLL